MSGYLVRRFLGMCLNLVLVSLFVFAMLRLVPGDAAIAILGENVTTEQAQTFREAYGVDAPLHEQYLDWSTGVLNGDFGKSLRSGRQVSDDFFSRLPITLEIVVLSFTMTTIIGITSGVLAALHQNSA